MNLFLKRECKISDRSFSVLISILICIAFSCAPARHIPEDKYLLNKNNIEVEGKAINKTEIQNYLLQKPNKKWILGIRLNLFFYNLSNPEKENGLNRWLRKIGEEPVIYDPYLTEQSYKQLKKYLENKGYYFSKVADSVSIRKPNTGRRNVVVNYFIKPNQPYHVRSINYVFEDTTLVSYILNDTLNSLLKRGMLFDKEILQEERARIENSLKNKGFYHFSKEYIYFDAVVVPDTSFLADITMGIKEYVGGESDALSKIKYHPRYKINRVTVYPDFNPLTERPSVFYDTLSYDSIRFIYNGKLKIKPVTILNYNYILPGKVYNSDNVDKTYQNLSFLGIYKFVNIEFSEPETSEKNGSGFYPLDAKIELTRKKVQSFLIEPLLTNSNNPSDGFMGDIGIKSNISYQNWNIFRGSEIFNLKLSGGFEILKDTLLTRTIEYGAETRIELPRFWLPFRSEQFIKKYGPKTFISLAINHRSDERYVRTYATANFGYTWKGNRYLRHSVYPVDMNFVQVDEDRSPFLDSIRLISYKYSFTDHLVGASRYTLEFNNQELGKIKNFVYFRMNIESAGNFLYLISDWSGKNRQDDRFYIINSPFSQYLKNDYDIRFFRVFNPKNTVVYRFFAGAAYPYGNTKTMPYEKRYFTGGPYSLRAWNAFTLGPGSYKNEESLKDNLKKYENIGDIKLEMNIEYRFKLFWKVEGALFADAGNIWDINYDETKEGSQFQWDRFYKEIAMGIGFGMRFDFSFFLLRLDLGMKIKDPSYPESERWLPFNHRYSKEDFPIQFGIGYPF